MPEQSPEPVAESIQKVVRLAQESYKKTSKTNRIGSLITGGFGTMASIACHAAIIAGWTIYNTVLSPHPFDPYPFSLLTLFVSFEGVLIALFVLMNQNRMSRRDELRENLSLQIEVLLEQEITTALVLLQKLCENQGIVAEDQKLKKMVQTTDIDHLASELEKQLPA